MFFECSSSSLHRMLPRTFRLSFVHPCTTAQMLSTVELKCCQLDHMYNRCNFALIDFVLDTLQPQQLMFLPEPASPDLINQVRHVLRL